MIARRRRTFWMRAVALGLLSLLMIPLLIQLVVQSQRAYSVKGVAEVLFQIFVWTQFVLLVMAAPAFSAGSISAERRLGTIDLLKLAAIRTPVFTLGKFAGAAALPFLLVLSEIPFLFIWTLFGGIPPESILGALALSASITVLLIAIGLFTSAMTPTAGVAMVASYVLAGVYLFSPLWGDPFFPAGFEQWTVPVALHGALNDTGLSPYPWWKAAGFAVVLGTSLSVVAGLFLVQPPAVGRFLDRTSIGSRVERRSRRVWSRPVLWREVYCGGGRRVTAFLNVVTLVSIGCLVGAANVTDDGWRALLGGFTIALPPLAGGVLGAIGVSLEKEGRSIAALLLTPSAASTVVVGKFAGALSRTLPLAAIPFLLGFVRIDQTWMWGAVASALLTMLLTSTGVLSSVLFARSAVAVAFNFGGAVLSVFCCFCNVGMFPMILMMGAGDPEAEVMRWVVLGFTVVVYAAIVATVLAIAAGFFETRARDAV